MKNWDVHGYNNEVCNAWKEPEPDALKTAAKQSLEKWLFYFDRFNNHEISARLDEELCSRTEEKMVEWQETSKMSWIEVRVLGFGCSAWLLTPAAVHVHARCRGRAHAMPPDAQMDVRDGLLSCAWERQGNLRGYTSVCIHNGP